MAKWYRVAFGNQISEHDVVGSTQHTITFLVKNWNSDDFREHKTMKISSSQRWFETREEAVSYVRDYLMRRIDSTQQLLDTLKRQLGDLK